MNTATPAPRPKQSRVRHTRAIMRDHTRRRISAPDDKLVEARIEALLRPGIFALGGLYRELGLRNRILTLPVMVAVLLAMLWRQFNGLADTVRVLEQEGLFWVAPTKVTDEGLSQRLQHLPAQLYHRLLDELLPHLRQAQANRHRPQTAILKWAQREFAQVLSFDGSTLDALWRKGNQEQQSHHLARLGGKMAGLLDVVNHLPQQVWYEGDSAAHDMNFWSKLEGQLVANTMLLIDRGFLNYERFAWLNEQQVWYICPAKHNTSYRIIEVLRQDTVVHDYLVRLKGQGAEQGLEVRLVEVKMESGSWYRYLTNLMDSQRLPAAEIVALYGQRWRIEEAFAQVKRLLGLAYLYSESTNAIQAQLWMTWLLYAVLVDLCDEVAEALGQRWERISIEMVYRSLWLYSKAHECKPELGLVEYLVANAKMLGVVKQRRKPPKGVAKT